MNPRRGEAPQEPAALHQRPPIVKKNLDGTPIGHPTQNDQPFAEEARCVGLAEMSLQQTAQDDTRRENRKANQQGKPANLE